MPSPVQDSLWQSADHPIRLPVFEGPLDLLLFLIRKNELDIHDIPIESVTHQYLAILRAMERLDLDVAGDFFVMAATLMYIKSRLLLPRHEQAAQPTGEEDDDHLDPRWEIVQQLLEYKKIKDAAAGLSTLIATSQNLLPREYRESDEDRTHRPIHPADRVEVWNVFNLVLRRLAEKMTLGEIHRDHVTVADRMEYLLQLRESSPSFTFTSLLPERPSLVFIVATFLAVLELTRLRKLNLAQTADFGDIEISRHDELPPSSPLADSPPSADLQNAGENAEPAQAEPAAAPAN